jgi:lipopolysaccharide export system protein LptC
MNHAVKQTLLLSLTVILLAGSGWYYAFREQVKPLDNETLATTIDTHVVQLTVRQFNAEGLLTNVLTTPFMHHIPKNNLHLLQTPHIVITQDNQPAWEIDSKEATSFAGGERIVFSTHVIVHQKGDAKVQESTLKTEEVTYFPKEKRATTNLFVTFEQPGNTIQSTGMNAYLDEKRVELLHRARGSYVPAKG